MFFIMGISSGEKKLNSIQTFVCNICGQFGKYEVFMTYTCLSLFFFPVLYWNRQYYVKTTCCNTQFSLSKEVGNRIRRGEAVTIQENDLTQNSKGYNSFFSKECPSCGYVAGRDDSFCPKCGSRL